MSVSHRVLCESVSFNVCLRHLIIRYKSHQADKQITHLLVIEKQRLKHLIVNHLSPPNWGKKMRVLAPWSSNVLCLSKGFFFRFSKVWVCFHGRSPLLGDHQRKHLKSLRIIRTNIDCHFPKPVFVFDVILGREGSYIYLLWWGSSKHVLERFLFFFRFNDPTECW